MIFQPLWERCLGVYFHGQCSLPWFHFYLGSKSGAKDVFQGSLFSGLARVRAQTHHLSIILNIRGGALARPQKNWPEMVTHIHFMMMEPSMPFSSGLYKKEGGKEESKEIVIRFLPFRHGALTWWCRLLDQFTNKKFMYSIEYICSERSEAGFAHFCRRSLSIFQWLFCRSVRCSFSVPSSKSEQFVFIEIESVEIEYIGLRYSSGGGCSSFFSRKIGLLGPSKLLWLLW